MKLLSQNKCGMCTVKYHNATSVKAPEVGRFAFHVSRSLHKRRERRHAVADEMVGLDENCPVYYRQPRISVVDSDLRPTTQSQVSK